MGLGNLIENAIKQLKDEKESIAEASSGVVDEDDLFDYDKNIVELTDEDFEDFRESEELAAAADDEYLLQLLEEGAER